MPDDHKYDEINPPPHTSIPVNGAEPDVSDDPMAIPAYQAPPTDRPVEVPEIQTKRRRGDRIVRDGQLLEFIEEELEGEKWTVIGPAPPPVPARGPGIDRTAMLIEQIADTARTELAAAQRNRMAFICAMTGIGMSLNYLSHAFAELQPDDVARYPKLIEELRDNAETLHRRLDALRPERKQAAE